MFARGNDGTASNHLRSSDRQRLVDGVALLVGFGTGLALIGFAEQFYRVFDPTPLTWRLTWGAMLASLAVGPSLPSGAARWTGVRALRRWRRAAAGGSRQEQGGLFAGSGSPIAAGTDLALFWMVLAGLALVTGLALAGLPLVLRGGGAAYQFLLREFLWTPTPLTVLEGGLVFTCGVVPFALAGWVIRCVHGLANPVDRWSLRPLALLLFGAAAAGLGAMVGNRNWIPPALLMVVGSGPFFLVAILAVRRADAHDSPDDVPDPEPPNPPRQSDAWPMVVRAAVVCVAAAGVCGMVLWGRALSVLGGLERSGMIAGYVLLLSATALGVLTCCSPARRSFSIAGFGVACVVAGVAVAAGVGVAAWWYSPAGSAPHGSWRFWAAAGLCAGVPWTAVGAAIACGHQAVLERVGSRASAGASLLTLSLVGVAAAILLILVPAVHAVGTYASMAGVALTLVAVGGILIIHDPDPVGRMRHNRVVAVFAVVVLMSVLLPRSAQGWLLTRPGLRLRLLESQWLTRSLWFRDGRPRVLIEPPPKPYADHQEFRPTESNAPLLIGDKIPPDMRVVLIGEASPALRSRIGIALAAGNHYLFDPSMVDVVNAAVGPSTPGRNRSGSMAGTRVIRTRPGRLDIVLLSLQGLPDSVRTRLVTSGTLERARASLRPDGLVAALVPLASCAEADVRRWVDRVAAVANSQFVWSCLSGPDAPILVLVFGREGAWRSRWSRWSSYRGRRPSELADVFGRG